MANERTYKEEAIKYHERKALELEISKIKPLLYPKLENLDLEIVQDFRRYLEEC